MPIGRLQEESQVAEAAQARGRGAGVLDKSSSRAERRDKQ